MTRTLRLAGVVIAGLFLALHLPFLPASLEDLDSINFALGVRHFDVSQHQPHPPGYPVFIAAAKVLHLGLSEVHALSLLSVVSGSLALLALVGLFAQLDRDRHDSAFTWIAALVVGGNPLYWLTSARPLSDLTGLAASMAIQALTLSVRSARAFALVCGFAAFAVGIRSQVVWLTVPLLVLALVRLPIGERLRAAWTGAIAYATGALLWFVPLIVVSGGPSAYWQALSAQGAEDLSGVAMLATSPTVRELALALWNAVIAPWGYWQAGAAVAMLALLGLVQMWRTARASLMALTAGFVPYLIFDVLFQETITTRYDLPHVVPAAYLAVRGLSLVSEAPAALLAIALVGYCATIDDAVLSRYARSEAPSFRMLGDWSAAAAAEGRQFRPPVLAMHFRESLDLRRSMQWRADALPSFASRLPSTVGHEWLEVVKYWNSGGAAPVWFVADPRRTDLALIHGGRRPAFYRWGFQPASLLGGSRPSEMDWHVLELPDWYLGEGWALTPETAGIASKDGRGPGRAPIEGWIRRGQGPFNILIGGRNLGTTGTPASLHIELDGVTINDSAIAPGFFLKTLQVPSLNGSSAYAVIRVTSDNADLAVEQFDAQPAGRVVAGFGDGWYEQEADPSRGELWRWTAAKAVVRVRAEGHAVSLSLRGEIEAASSSHIVIRAGDRTVGEFDIGRSFQRVVLIPADALAGSETLISIETSASWVPADSPWRRSGDRRRLGLKLYECRVAAAS